MDEHTKTEGALGNPEAFDNILNFRDVGKMINHLAGET
jgi:hypothetical protein